MKVGKGNRGASNAHHSDLGVLRCDEDENVEKYLWCDDICRL